MNSESRIQKLGDASWFLGRAPLHFLAGKGRETLPEEGRVSLFLSFLGFCAFMLFLFFYGFGQWLILSGKEVSKSLPIAWEFTVYVLLFCLLLILRIGFVFGSVLSYSTLRPFRRMTSPSFIQIYLALFWAIFSKVFLVGFIVISLYSSVIVTGNISESEVCFLHYAKNAPEWVVRPGFLAMARQARKRWGGGAAGLAPLTWTNLHIALENNRFVYIAAHGRDGEIWIGDTWLGPDNIKAGAVGDDLTFVYNSACYTGLLAEEWEEAFAPAQVITFEGLSSMTEHLLFLFFRAPGMVEDL